MVLNILEKSAKEAIVNSPFHTGVMMLSLNLTGSVGVECFLLKPYCFGLHNLSFLINSTTCLVLISRIFSIILAVQILVYVRKVILAFVCLVSYLYLRFSTCLEIVRSIKLFITVLTRVAMYNATGVIKRNITISCWATTRCIF